ncbi:hypothetical protein [Streptomyces sp. NBC_01744]|uniref:hypothetical protein n=1 Tax=Streptomyces sp. NBC_01744 TaxID=2975927 RepID=UPI003D9A7704|nr:hypothetical protein OIE70_11205 [Streptomyces sp. NBC_01744]
MLGRTRALSSDRQRKPGQANYQLHPGAPDPQIVDGLAYAHIAELLASLPST